MRSAEALARYSRPSRTAREICEREMPMSESSQSSISESSRVSRLMRAALAIQ
jgi:hypothetical protein